MARKFAKPNNIFLQSRLNAGLSRPTAASLINCSADSLTGYEVGRRTPSAQLIIKMAKAYHDDNLVFEALQQTAFGQYLKDTFNIVLTRCSFESNPMGRPGDEMGRFGVNE